VAVRMAVIDNLLLKFEGMKAQSRQIALTCYQQFMNLCFA